jgi:Uma2 family endonuclease
MSTLAKPWYTPEQYLALERQAETKSEYFDGEIFAMAGASREHNLIVGNVVRELGTQLKRRPCELYPGDMRVRVTETGLYTYPDVVVVCGEPQFEDEQGDTLLNPTLIVEVLSSTT